MRRARLLYTATVRPAMLYGAQVWGVRDDGGAPAKSLLEPLQKVQNQCLRRITGAYHYTPIAAMEKEAAIPPIQLHIETIALQRAAKTAFNKVEKELAKALKGIWKTLVKRQRKTRWPLVPLKALRDRVKDRKNEIQGFLAY